MWNCVKSAANNNFVPLKTSRRNWPIRKLSSSVSVIQKTLEQLGIPKEAASLIEDTSRDTAAAFMKMNQYVDVLIPRGGAGLIRAVVNQATIPVIETGTGNCHIFVDETADFDMAVNIIMNAKTQRIGDRKSTRLNSSHRCTSRMPSSA